MSNETIRLILMSSVILVLVIGFIVFFVVLFKVHKIKSNLKKDNMKLELELKQNKEKDFELVQLNNNEEDIEFIINSIIRNKYTSVLLLNKTSIENLKKINELSNSNIIIDSKYWNEKELNEISLFKNVTIQSEEKFSNYNLIIFLDYDQYKIDQLFEKYEKYLKTSGMMIFNNTNILKKQVKLLKNKICEYKYKYDILKWYKGFVVIIKEKINYGK